ncbi:MAG: AAA family ATPase, partial [Acidimicrobiales bacterium]
MLDLARAARSLPEGERAFVTLVFSDIVGSTDLVAVTEPEIVRALFGVYRDVAADAIEPIGGTILQYLGDGIVACFGYPVVREDAARRAVLASLGLIERMKAASPDLLSRFGTDLSIRIGLHTGTVVVTRSASGSAQPADIVGATAHVAARLQAEAEPDTVVVSDATRQLVEEHFDMEPIGVRSLKGFSEPMALFRVVRTRRSAALAGGGKVGSSSLVGRESERRLLDGAWLEVVSALGEGGPVEQTVLAAVRGPAGIGKSRLSAELCQHVMGAGFTVFEAGCSPYHTNVALWPVAQMLEERLGLYGDRSHDEQIAELEQRLEAAGLESEAVVPLLGPLLGLGTDEDRPRPELDALALRERTLETLVDWVTNVARATPCLLIVDDLHWADPTTVDLLALLRRRASPGMMVVVTSRHEMPPELSSPAVDIELGPLEGDEAAQLVAAITRGGGLDPTEEEVIIARAGGVPLFIHELAHRAVMASPAETLPPRLQELMTARLRGSE